MSSLALEQVESEALDMGAIAEQIHSVAIGIAFCAKRVKGDDLYGARVVSLGAEVAALAKDFEAYAHREIADYEALADEVESSDRKLVALRLNVSLLEGNVNRLQDELAAANNNHASAISALENTASQLRDELQRLTCIHANELEQSRTRSDRLEGENKDLRNQLAEKTRQLHSELNAHIDSRKLLQQKTREHTLTQAALDVLYKEQDINNGFTGDDVWTGLKNPRLTMYMHTFNYPLKYPHDPRDIDTPRFVNNLNFHINIRTTYGVDLVTRLDEWGMVQYQTLELFKNEIPKELYATVIKAHHDIVAVRNPHLKRFFDWAHTFPLTNLAGLTDANRALLKSELEVTNLAQLGCCFTTDLERLKGVGQTTARKWRALAYEQGAAWMAEHGTVELEKMMTGVNTPALPQAVPARIAKPTIGRSKKHRKGKR